MFKYKVVDSRKTEPKVIVPKASYQFDELEKKVQLCWKLVEGTQAHPESWWEVSTKGLPVNIWKVYLRKLHQKNSFQDLLVNGFENSWQARSWVDLSQGIEPGNWVILNHWVTLDKKYALRKAHNSRKWDIEVIKKPGGMSPVFAARDFSNRQEALDWLNKHRPIMDNE